MITNLFHYQYVRKFQVEVFCVVTPCSVVVGHQRFGGPGCHHLHCVVTLCNVVVYMYGYQPEGWLDPHTVPAPDAHTHTHAHILYMHAHTPMHSTHHTTTARRTKPGVKWGRMASSFPPPYCTQPGNDEVHCMTKLCNANLIGYQNFEGPYCLFLFTSPS
jgi:hypothetical protein